MVALCMAQNARAQGKYANFARQWLTKATYQVAKLGKAGKSDANLMGQKIDYDLAAGKPTWRGILMAWLA